MQALGIMLEDFVQWAYRSLFLQNEMIVGQGKEKGEAGGGGKLEKKSRNLEMETWQRVVGYLWVAFWLVLTTPAWSYQNMRVNGGPLFPFSLIGKIKSTVGP